MPNGPKKQGTSHGSRGCGKIKKSGIGGRGGNTTFQGKFCYAGNTLQKIHTRNYTDVPREQKKANKDKYSAEEIKAMLAVAEVDEADLIHFFLLTGVRDEEAA